MASRAQSMVAPALDLARHGRVTVLLYGGGDAEDHQGHRCGNIGVKDIRGRDAGDPHHGGGGVPHHAPGAAGVGGGDDGGQVADVDLVAKTPAATVPPIRAAAMLSRKLDRKKIRTKRTKPPGQPAGRKRGSILGDAAVLEVAGQQGETQQQAQQVGEHHPLVPQVPGQPLEPRPVLKPVKPSLKTVMTASPVRATWKV